jgi:hypothetical protein
MLQICSPPTPQKEDKVVKLTRVNVVDSELVVYGVDCPVIIYVVTLSDRHHDTTDSCISSWLGE